jgi:arsenate reductase (thioredoxin)
MVGEETARPRAASRTVRDDAAPRHEARADGRRPRRACYVGRPMPGPHRVLFVCVANSCQSQMAEAWLRRLGGERFVVRSAGTAPRHLHPLATRAMQEVGVDIGAQRGKGVDAVQRERFDLCVTLSETARADCPPLPNVARTEAREFDDPAWLEEDDGDLDAFRRLRDELRAFVEALVALPEFG